MTEVLTAAGEGDVEPKDQRQQFVSSSPCPSDEHPLEFTYVFSYFVRPQGKFDPEEYAAYVQPVASFNSVEQFWNTYRHIKRPSDITDKVDFHMFKEGIKPVWEDAANRKVQGERWTHGKGNLEYLRFFQGGKWILRLRKGLSSRIWENLLLAMIGEQFLVGEEICGAVCSIRNQVFFGRRGYPISASSGGAFV
ncbi:unnamed protein product [Toxocara canis]|uniref:EIF-4F 25 kDa subunit n=1 Tax=Toxocara canis TaxID=6265 RepID=A0A183VG20_TOXCA|nr:unnamed protein product [Toxocara canis]